MTATPSAVVTGGEKESALTSGLEALERLGATSPPHYLSPSPELSRLARDASRHLFSSLLPFCPKKLPLDRLLAEESFDAEQIWQQIELQSQPLNHSIRKDLRKFGKLGAVEIRELFGGGIAGREEEEEEKGVAGSDGVGDMEEEEEDGEEDEEDGEDDDDEEDDSEEGDEEEEEQDGAPAEKGGLDDGFFDTKELEKFIENEEAREYGGNQKEKIEEDGEDDDDKIGDFDDEDSGEEAAYARFEDFYGKKKKMSSVAKDKENNQKSKKKSKLVDENDQWEVDEGLEGSQDESQNSETDDEQHSDGADDQNNETLSTFERQRKKNQSKIEQIEKELVAPKSWTMLGEVTASKRPKNSALEVDLDFQHNKGRPPSTTEETTASTEELILKRIREGHFDEVQRAATLPQKAPKELKELDENKSQKGLAEIYEEEYVQKSGLADAPLSLSDEQKKEATVLFKKLCLKLDALSHFHFTPKPVIEDMSIQANVPALAMEEIAPVAVSDAAMLAPEEIFTGKGDIKEEKELTQADRKRRRAKKKRKFKAESEKMAAKKARQSTLI